MPDIVLICKIFSLLLLVYDVGLIYVIVTQGKEGAKSYPFMPPDNIAPAVYSLVVYTLPVILIVREGKLRFLPYFLPVFLFLILNLYLDRVMKEK